MSPILTATSPAAQDMLPLITNKGVIRRSKPKDGNAAYVWRMVAFSVSTDPKQHCMPMTADFDVSVPEGWKVEAPQDWLETKIENTHRRQSDVDFCIDRNGSVRAYHVENWSRYDRRKQYIKEVLDPIVDEIVKAVPPRRQAGTTRWARAFGVI
jgi:hypothetical protein